MAPIDEPWTRLPERIALVGVLALAAIVYLPTLGFGFVYDDHWTFLANGFLRCPEDLGVLLSPRAHELHVVDAFRPTAVVFDMLSYQVFGAHAHWHHLVSVTLHVGVCAAAWRWLAGRGTALALRVATVGLFAVLGIHAEAVAVVSYREDLLAALCGLLALTAADRSADATDDRRAGWRAAIVAGLWQALAVGAKLSAAPVPAVFLVFHRVGPWPARAWARAGPPFAALTLGTAIALAQQLVVSDGGSPYAGQPGLFADTWSRAEVLATSIQIDADVLRQIVLPGGFSPEYVDRPAGLGDAATILCGLGLALAVVHVVACALRRRAPQWVAIATTTIALWLPTSNLVAMPNMRADRFAYLPSLPVCLGLAIAALALGRVLARRGPGWLELAPLIVLIVIEGASAQAAATVYKSDARLWDAALRRAPHSARAHAIMAELLTTGLASDETGTIDPVRRARAEAHCRRARALGPDQALPRLCAARLAVVDKRWSEAAAWFAEAVPLARAREDRILTAWASAVLDVPELPYDARVAQAEAIAERAIREFPYASEVFAAAGRLYHRLGRPDRAFALYRRARTLRPERWDVVLWGLELALDLGDSSAAWAIWQSAEDLLADADPRRLDAARRRLWDATSLFTNAAPPDLPLGDLADDP